MLKMYIILICLFQSIVIKLFIKGQSLISLFFVIFRLQSKIVRVLNLWQKNGVFKIEVIQPLLDMAAGSSSSGSVPGVDNGPGGGGE